MAITKMISEVFLQAKGIDNEADQIKFLKFHKKNAMVSILFLALSDVEFIFNRENLPDYTPDNEPIPFNPLNMYKSYTALRYFRKDFPRTQPMHIDNLKRIFFSQVNQLAKSEAELFCNILCKEFDYFSVDVALAAFPELNKMLNNGDRLSEEFKAQREHKKLLKKEAWEQDKADKLSLKLAEEEAEAKILADLELQKNLIEQQEKHAKEEADLKEKQEQVKLGMAAEASIEKLQTKEGLAKQARKEAAADNKRAKAIKKKRARARRKKAKKKSEEVVTTKPPIEVIKENVDYILDDDIQSPNRDSK